MENTSKLPSVSDRDIFYYRQRFKNRIFEAITAFFAEEAEQRGITKKDIAESLRRDPAQITRWFSAPSNLTADTISDLLVSLEAEMDINVVRFKDRPAANEMHLLIARFFHPEPKIDLVKRPAPSQPSHKIKSATGSSSPEVKFDFEVA
jgi:plasmid maintenance system antidote protein VapI